MPEIVKQIEIAAPPEAVWRAIADFGAVAAWAPAVKEAHWISDARSGVGCGRYVTASTGHTVRQVVTEWEDGRSLAFQIPDGMASVIAFLQERWSVRPAPGGAQVVVEMAYRSKFGPFGAAVARLMVLPVLAKMLAENLAGLKGYVESGKLALSTKRENLRTHL